MRARPDLDHRSYGTVTIVDGIMMHDDATSFAPEAPGMMFDADACWCVAHVK
jgi:hypothetical protein